MGASDKLPNTIWATYFIEAQGIKITKNVYYQDNTSAMKILKNSKMSCGQKSKHMNIHYFFVRDRLNEHKISLVYCPTEYMITDFFTKPLQGKLFKTFRDAIMGVTQIESIYMTATKEHVEINDSQQSNCESKKSKNNPISWAEDVVLGKNDNAATLRQTTST